MRVGHNPSEGAALNPTLGKVLWPAPVNLAIREGSSLAVTS